MANTKVTSAVIADNAVGIDQLNVSDGTNGQVLTTNGSGTLSFSTISGYTDSDVESYLDSGTSSPTFSTATVSGTFTVNTDANSTLTIADGGSDAVTLYGGTGDELYIGANNAYKLRFKTDGNIVMDNGGNLGIGEATPLAKLHIQGTGTSGQVSTSFLLENASSGTAGMDITGAAGSSRLRFLYGGGVSTGTNQLTEALNIVLEGSGAGNVGIGTTNPTGAKLHVVGAVKATDLIAHDTTGINLQTSNGTKRLIVDNSGSVIVGSGGAIHFDGNTSTGFIYETSSNLQLRSDNDMTFYTYAGAWQVRMTIADGGLISGDFNDTSDVALKENIVAIDDGMSVISQMRPVSFDWKDVVAEDKEGNEVTVPSGKGSTKGLIAQEVEEIDPELVVGEEGQKAINTSGVLAYAIKAIQEQQTIIDDLKARIETLENA